MNFFWIHCCRVLTGIYRKNQNTVSFRKRYESTRNAPTRIRRGTASITRIIRDISSIIVFSVILFAPPEFYRAGIYVVHNAVEGLLLFWRRRILPVALDFFYLPDYIPDIGHGLCGPVFE